MLCFGPSYKSPIWRAESRPLENIVEDAEVAPSLEKELSGALSNPRLQVELQRLTVFRPAFRHSERILLATKVKPRCAPIISTVAQVLQLGDGQPMRLKDIHLACIRLLGVDVSYRALKNGLSDHQRSRYPLIVRVERGLYRLPRD